MAFRDENGIIATKGGGKGGSSKLVELEDVVLTNIQTDDTLSYDASTKTFVNKQLDIPAKDDFILVNQGAEHKGKSLVVGDDGMVIPDDLDLSEYATKEELAEVSLTKIPNVTIFGNPNIQHGQVSGFSASNFVQMPFEFNVDDSAFDLIVCFTPFATSSMPIVNTEDETGGIMITTNSSGINVNVFDKNNIQLVKSSISLTMETNKTYFVKVSWNKLQYTISHSIDGGNTYIVDNTTPSAVPPGPCHLEFGRKGTLFLNGSINLNKCELFLNGQYYWEGMDDVGMATRLDIDLYNISEEGIDKINEIVSTKYVNKESIVKDFSVVPTDTNIPSEKLVSDSLNELDAKIDELQLYKFPNAIIIGDPTINNGQISNFSNDDYLKFPFLVDFKGKPFEITMAFTTGTNVTNQENIFDSDFGLAFAIRNAKFVIAISSNGTSWNLGESVGTHTIEPNTAYRVKLAWDGSQYTLDYSIDGGESYTRDITKTSTEQPYPKQIFIGVGQSDTTVLNYFTGIINMNRASVSIDDTVIWQGMDDVGLATRLATDVSNIDEAGVEKVKGIIATEGYIKNSNLMFKENKNYNLIAFPYYSGSSKVQEGVTYTAFDNGEISAIGLATSNIAYYLTNADVFPAGTYRLSGCPKTGSDTTYYQYIQNADDKYATVAKDFGDGATFTLDTDTRLRIGLYVLANYDANITFKPMIVKVLDDGLYPTEYQRYAKTNSELTDEISLKEFEFVDIKMLGWEVPTDCVIQNTVNGNQFKQNVSRVDLGTLDWAFDDEKKWFYSKQANVKAFANDTVFNGYLDGYDKYSRDGLNTTEILSGVAINMTNTICIKDSNYTDIDSFKFAISGKYLYFELADDKKITKTIDGNEITESFKVLGTHKNLVSANVTTSSSAGITCTNNNDGTYTIKGTNNTSSNATFMIDVVINGAGKGKLVGVPKGSDGITLQTNYDGSWGISSYWDTGNGAILPDISKIQRMAILVSPGKTVNHIIKPMLTSDLNASYDDYEPYTGDGKDLMYDVAHLTQVMAKIWTGTQAEYDAITTKDPTTFYMIEG